MKKYFYFKTYILFFAIFSTIAFGMEKKVSIEAMSQKPIKHIPTYLYNNPNQYCMKKRTCELLKTLKNYTQRIKANQIDTSSKFPTALDKERAKEDFDWIYTLESAEETLLQKSINTWTPSDIVAVNQRLTRLTLDVKAGQWRDDAAIWKLKSLSPTEVIYYNAFQEGYVDKNDIIKILQNKSVHMSEHDMSLMMFKYCTEHQVSAVQIDVSEINSWLKDKSLDFNSWIRERMHFFPCPDEIVPLMNEMFITIQEKEKINPVDAAAYAMFKTIAIHPFSSAHKRTGRVLAAVILLQHGYLPPVFTHSDTFDNTLIKAISANNFEAFVEIFVQAVKDTQEKVKSSELLA